MPIDQNNLLIHISVSLKLIKYDLYEILNCCNHVAGLNFSCEIGQHSASKPTLVMYHI